MLKKAKKLVSEIAKLVNEADEHSKTYSNPGDSCSYNDEFNKAQQNKDTKAANAIRVTMDFFLDNEKEIEKSDNPSAFLNELKMMMTIRENFLANFKKNAKIREYLS